MNFCLIVDNETDPISCLNKNNINISFNYKGIAVLNLLFVTVRAFWANIKMSATCFFSLIGVNRKSFGLWHQFSWIFNEVFE